MLFVLVFRWYGSAENEYSNPLRRSDYLRDLCHVRFGSPLGTIRHSSSQPLRETFVSLEMKSISRRMFSIALDSNQRLVRLRQWLSPLVKLKQFDHSQETADNLISELKSLLQESSQSGELSPGLLTVLRLIQYLSIAPESQFTLGAKIELKYDYMLLKLFHQGIYSLLIIVLEVSVCF